MISFSLFFFPRNEPRKPAPLLSHRPRALEFASRLLSSSFVLVRPRSSSVVTVRSRTRGETEAERPNTRSWFPLAVLRANERYLREIFFVGSRQREDAIRIFRGVAVRFSMERVVTRVSIRVVGRFERVRVENREGSIRAAVERPRSRR